MHVGAVDRAVAVSRVSGCRTSRFEEEVTLIVDDGRAADVRE